MISTRALRPTRVGPGFWLYAPDANGVLQLKLTPHRAGTLISLARHSALARYVIINLGIQNRLFSIRWLAETIFGKPANAQPRYAGNTDASTDRKAGDRIRSTRSTPSFAMCQNASACRRSACCSRWTGSAPPMRRMPAPGTYFDLMRRAFIEKAAAHGYEVIDLDTPLRPAPCAHRRELRILRRQSLERGGP